jgi:hypothetical protein
VPSLRRAARGRNRRRARWRHCAVSAIGTGRTGQRGGERARPESATEAESAPGSAARDRY